MAEHLMIQIMRIRNYIGLLVAMLGCCSSSVLGQDNSGVLTGGHEMQLVSSVESFHVARGLVGAFQEFDPHFNISLTVDRDGMGYVRNNRASERGYAYIGTGLETVKKEFRAIPIYREVVVFVVHKNNQLSSISVNQIKWLLTKKDHDEEIQWDEILEGNVENISIHGPLVVSETSRFIMEAIIGKVIGGYEEHERNADIVNAVSKDPLSIGFLSLGFVPDGVVKILEVTDEKSVGVGAPTTKRVPKRYPIQRNGFLVMPKRNSGKETSIGKFAQFVLSDRGRDAVLASGLLPAEDIANKPQKK